MALEIILIAGHGSILLGMKDVIPFVLPILLCFQLFVFYYLSNKLGNLFIWLGIAGIALLSIGFSYENSWVFFLGSSSIVIFAFNRVFHGQPVALIWAGLNLFFVFATGTMILS
jgi:hypothetical protein